MSAPEPPVRTEVVLLPSSVAEEPEEIELLNEILEEAGHGRPLGQVELTLAVVAVDADPATVAEVLRRAVPEHGQPVPQLTIVLHDQAGTDDSGTDQAGGSSTEPSKPIPHAGTGLASKPIPHSGAGLDSKPIPHGVVLYSKPIPHSGTGLDSKPIPH